MLSKVFSKFSFVYVPAVALLTNLIFFCIFVYYPSYNILLILGLFNISLTFLSLLFFIVFNLVFYGKFSEKILFSFISVGLFLGILMFSQTLLESGHDQGGYLGYAARIAHSGNLNISDDTTVSMFQYVYRGGKIDLAWPNVEFWTFFLSTFYYILELWGFSLCISFLQVWGLLFIFIIADNFLNAKKTTLLLFFLAYAFSYYTIHYTRSGYIENILFFQLWGCVCYFLLFLSKQNKIYYFLSFFFCASILFTRPEGIIYLVSFFIATGLYLFKRKILLFKHIIFLIGLGVIISFSIDLFIFKGFLSEGIKNISIYWSYNYKYAGQFSILGVIITYTVTAQIMSLSGFGYLSWKIKNNSLIYIFIFLLPQLMFLLFPNIQLVMPWAYRRFWPGVFVLGVLLFYIFYRRNIFLFKLNYILIIFVSLFSGASIYGMSWSENIFNQLKNINIFLNTIPNQNFGLISNDHVASIYSSILSDFFGKSLVIDNAPFKEKKILDYYFDSKDYIYIFSTMSSEQQVINLYKKQLNINIQPDDIILEKSFVFSSSQIPPYFDANSLFGSKKDFLGYTKLMQEGRILSEKSIKKNTFRLNIFRLNNNYFHQINTQEGFQKLDNLSEFNVSDLRV